MPRETTNLARVGALVLAALAVLAVGIFTIGEKNNLWSRKNDYFARFPSVSGLAEGNHVQLNGVKVGRIESIVLPVDFNESLIKVEFSVARRYGNRVRADSTAEIKTVGLLGDKYIEISSGSPAAEVTPSGAEIKAAVSQSMDTLMKSGEDVMANVTEISASLRVILDRMQKGEGLLGQLVSDPVTGQKISDRLLDTLASIQHVAERIETGEGALPRLITDRTIAAQLAQSMERFASILQQVETGDGALPSLLYDASTRDDLKETVASLKTTSANLAEFSREIRDAKGLLPRLLYDEKFGEEVSQRLETTLARVDRLTAELESGDGTAAKLIHDPEIYQAIDDILVGVNESRLLRWLIRNRQKAGIAKRYEAAQTSPPQSPSPSPPKKPPTRERGKPEDTLD